MLEQSKFRPNNSACTSSIWIVPIKVDGCKKIEMIIYELYATKYSCSCAKGNPCTYFTTLDLASDPIGIPSSSLKLTNAAATFQCVTDYNLRAK